MCGWPVSTRLSTSRPVCFDVCQLCRHRKTRTSSQMQAWLQEFAWTEAEKLQKWKARAGNLRLTSSALHELNKEPMFCFESAIKLYYYSHIIYHYDKVRHSLAKGYDLL